MATDPQHPDARTADQRERAPIVRFVLVFALCLLVFQVAFLSFALESTTLARYLALCARASGGLLDLAGFDVLVIHNRLVVEGAGFEVGPACSGLQPIAMFAIAVLAFPADWRAKLFGLALGGALLCSLNLVRIASLVVVQQRLASSFELVHLALWPMALILVALSTWAVWARRTGTRSGA